MTLGFCQYEIGENNRVAWNIVSTDIQHPGDIIQCSQNMHFGTVLFHLFAYFCKTLRSGFTGIFCIKDPHGFCGKCRAVRPDLTDQVASIGSVFSSASPSISLTTRPSKPMVMPSFVFAARYSSTVGTPSWPIFIKVTPVPASSLAACTK